MKIITIILFLVLISSVSAYSQVDYRKDPFAQYNNYYNPLYRTPITQQLPATNPYYEQYRNTYDFLSEDKYKRLIKTQHYQQAKSPFIIVSSPYGAKNPAMPWGRVYGDLNLQKQPERPKPLYNPFYGFPYIRTNVCYGTICRLQNVFPETFTN